MKKLMTSLLLGGLLAAPMAIAPNLTTPIANAAGCGVATICDGGGSGPSSPNNGGKPSKPKPGGGNGGTQNGGGGGGSSNGGSNIGDGSTWKIVYSKNFSGKCSVRADGAKPVRLKLSYREIYKNTDEKKKPDSNSWKYEGYYPHAGVHGWSRFALQSETCLYASAFTTKTVNCNISFSVSLDKTRPDRKTLKQVTKGTGYKQGSKNYNSCLSSSSNVNVSVPVTEYGVYSTKTWRKVQTMTVKVPVTKNQYTGTYDKLEVVGVGAPYTTSPRTGMTGSLDCKSGWKSPAIAQPKYWTDEGCEGSFESSYICEKPDVQVDIAKAGARALRKVKTGSTLQLLNDGKPREVIFNQSIKGKNIKIKSTKTTFTRQGTPWDNSLSLNKNAIEFSQTARGAGILAKPNETKALSGNKKSVFVSAYQASAPSSKTTLTQKLSWSGTKKVSSVKISGINAVTGKIETTGTTVTVPTSGSCSQSIGLEYIRTVGDAQ